MKLTNYSIAVRIGVGFGLMSLMAVIMGSLAWWGLAAAGEVGAAAADALQTMRWLMAGMAGLTALLGMGSILLLRNSVQTPIERVVHAVSRVAGGDLESKFVSHGRGFAVVAAEVRSLAQRCAAAAKDVKTLIGTSMEKAESGSRLVNEAGTTMQELLAGVTQASSLIAGIAQAGREQSQNLGEVNQAIMQVDTVTQQNAALVEQTTATAGSLKEQSEHLADTIRKFKLTA